MKNLWHCQDDFSWGEGDGHSSNVLVGLFPVMTDFLWIWLMIDYNITCDEDSNNHVTRIQRSQPTRGGTVWQLQMPANRDQLLS